MKGMVYLAKGNRGGKRSGGGGGGGSGTNLPMVIKQPGEKKKASYGIKAPSTPKTQAQSLAMTNKDNYYKEYGYRINCQRCVWAYEMNRRGYNVEALPNNDNLGRYGAWHSIAESGLDIKYAASDPFARGNTNKKNEANIKKQMAEWGDGSRAGVILARRGHSGHVFNVEYKAGKITVYEAQTGETHSSLAKYLSEQKAVPGYVQFFRTDTVKFKESEFPKYVKERG